MGKVSQTADHLLQELERLRQRVKQLEDAEAARRQTEKTLTTGRQQAEEEAKLRAKLLDAVGQAVVATDPSGVITYWNHSAATLYGWSVSEVIGRQITDILVSEEMEERATEIIASLAQGQTWTGEFPLRRRDGHSFPALVTDAPIFDDQGQIIGIIWVSSDISERKQAEEALVTHAQELARSNDELRQFTHIVSHDLQEPLRMVASYVQLLALRYKGQLDSEANEFIDYAVSGVTRMQELIKALLEYSQVGTRSRQFEPTDCELVLHRALANLQVVVEETGAIVTHDPLPTVRADPIQLAQLMQNLIANAIKFQGEQSPSIHISAGAMDQEWVFSVADNGIGIEPEHKESVFEIFRRLYTWEEYPGTGIGLAICRKIVERHGGRIWVESRPGQGSTFYFTIPARNESQ